MTAKISLKYLAVFCAVEYRSPRLELADAVGRFFRVKFGHPPVIYVLAAPHRVGEMDLPIVAVVDIAHCRSHSTLGHNSVSLAEKRLADQTNAYTRSRSLDRSA